MLVLRKGSGDENVLALRPRQDFLARQLRRLRARKIWRDYEKYRPTIPPGVEPFSDCRSEHGNEVVSQMPKCDVINLHWIGGFLDWFSFFKALYADSIPAVWRL